MNIGIIGSTGIKIELLTSEYNFLEVEVDGKTCRYYRGIYGKHLIYLTARNMYNGNVPPHLIDYIRLMKMFKILNVDFVVATSVVGSLSVDYKPGEYVVLDQFIDMTKNNPHTVYGKKAFCFVDFTYPYCEKIRSMLINACNQSGVVYHKKGCYVGVDGPRYETSAEVKAFHILGGDVVGMTNVTEAIMARELGICYASIAIISNYGAGMLNNLVLRQNCYDKTIEILDNTISIIKKMLETVITYKDCDCRHKNQDMIYTSLVQQREGI